MILAKQMGRNGKLHWLPGPLAWSAICGKTDRQGDWMHMAEHSTVFWSVCKRCQSIKAKSDAACAKGKEYANAT